jgi:hypothetical protein
MVAVSVKRRKTRSGGARKMRLAGFSTALADPPTRSRSGPCRREWPTSSEELTNFSIRTGGAAALVSIGAFLMYYQ